MLFLRTEPPIDEITQLGVAQLMTTGIATKADAAESQARQRVRRLPDECDGADRVLVTGREPGRHASRADSTGKDPTMQHRRMREASTIAGDVWRAAPASGVPGDEHVRLVHEESGVGSDPFDAVQRVRKVGRHITLLVAYLPSRIVARFRCHYREPVSLGEFAEGGDHVAARLSASVQNHKNRQRVDARSARNVE